MPFYWISSFPDSTMDLEYVEAVLAERCKAFESFDGSLEHAWDTPNSDDYIGHLFMCIIAYQGSDLKKKIVQGERSIFAHRLQNISSADMKVMFAKLLEILNLKDTSKSCVKEKDTVRLIKNIILTVEERVHHVFNTKHSQRCRKSRLVVPFTLPLKMVAERKIELVHGKAKIPCSQWKELLDYVFEYFLDMEMEVINKSEVVKHCMNNAEDDRVRQLVVRCATGLRGCYVTDTITSYAAVDAEVKHYPPCMANLHQILRRTHRLSYDSRYKYQVQHIYGVIGTGRRKSHHPCTRFTGVLTSKMDGGCPFVHNSRETVRAALPEVLTDIEDLMTWHQAGQPGKACAAYLRSCETVLGRTRYHANSSGYTVGEISSPLQFYGLSKRIWQHYIN